MTQPKFITSPSYDSLHNAAVTMVREAKLKGKIDYVLAPVRGGLMFGVIASHILNVPLIPVEYSSKQGAGDDKIYSNILPDLPMDSLVLLVDDIVDTGMTMSEVVSYYANTNVQLITAAFHFKENAVYHPDLYYWRIPADSEFIVYPYEA